MAHQITTEGGVDLAPAEAAQITHPTTEAGFPPSFTAIVKVTATGVLEFEQEVALAGSSNGKPRYWINGTAALNDFWAFYDDDNARWVARWWQAGFSSRDWWGLENADHPGQVDEWVPSTGLTAPPAGRKFYTEGGESGTVEPAEITSEGGANLAPSSAGQIGAEGGANLAPTAPGQIGAEGGASLSPAAPAAITGETIY